MDESEENMSSEDMRSVDSPNTVKIKPKKRSLVERELETNLTARVTSPVTIEGTSTSRYGRARRLKTWTDLDAEKVMKPLKIDTSKSQPQAYKMHASNSPIRKESPKKVVSSLEDQIENIYNENISLSRFGSEEQAKAQSPAKKFSKIYIRKDLIQKPDPDTVMLIKNLFSPAKSNSHLNNILERSSEKYSLNGHGNARNGFPDTSSVVKTLDFDSKKKKDPKDNNNPVVSKSKLFELEATCPYQVGDLAWARVGTYPFWPCIVTREPFTDLFVKKKLYGRIEHDIVHVTFFGDNGRRGWIVDNMLQKYSGRTEFEAAREKFTPEAKKKDPRLYAAYFVSEKKLPLWNVSVEEAETILREPKRLRIDVFHDMLRKARASKTTPKREKGGKISRTDSDVSLSESLYDTLFSEDDGKADDAYRTKKSRNKSLDVSEVVTACLDNMAAKSGIINVQRQSHMDRWLQKAKSKTPEKTQPKIHIKTEREKRKEKTKRKSKESRKPRSTLNESHNSDKNLLPHQNEHDYSSVNFENHGINDSINIKTDFDESGYAKLEDSSGICVIAKVESLSSGIEDSSQDDIITTVVNDDILITDADHMDKDMDNISENRDTIAANNLLDNIILYVENSIKITENKEITEQTNKKSNNDGVNVTDKITSNSVLENDTPNVENSINAIINQEMTEHKIKEISNNDVNDIDKITANILQKNNAPNVEIITSSIQNEKITEHVTKQMCSDGETVMENNFANSVLKNNTPDDENSVSLIKKKKILDHINNKINRDGGKTIDNISENCILENEIPNVENITPIEIEIKVELPLKSTEITNSAIKTRRSKRMRQSDVEKNDSIADKNRDGVHTEKNTANSVLKENKTIPIKNKKIVNQTNKIISISGENAIEKMPTDSLQKDNESYVEINTTSIEKEKIADHMNYKNNSDGKTAIDIISVDCMVEDKPPNVKNITAIENELPVKSSIITNEGLEKITDHMIDKNSSDGKKAIDIISVDCIVENKTPNAENVSPIENEIEIKVELPVKSSVITTEGLETRRSKRKRRSNVEKNVSNVDKNSDGAHVMDNITANIVLKNNTPDVENNTISIKDKKITDQTNKIIISEGENATEKMHTDRLQENNEPCVEINTTSIEKEKITDHMNKKNSCDGKTAIDMISVDCIVENKTPNAENVSPIDNEIEIKVELPGKSSVISNEGLETRRSKRKRRSNVEKNVSNVDKNSDGAHVMDNITANIVLKNNTPDVENNTISIKDKKITDQTNKIIISEGENATEKMHTDRLQENNEPCVEINTTSIEKEKITDHMNKKNSSDGKTAIDIISVDCIVENKTPNAVNVSPIQNEIEIKVELPEKGSVITNEGLETRRSKRKRRSTVEKNVSIVDKNSNGVHALDNITANSVLKNKTPDVENNSISIKDKKITDQTNKINIGGSENAIEKISTNSIQKNNEPCVEINTTSIEKEKITDHMNNKNNSDGKTAIDIISVNCIVENKIPTVENITPIENEIQIKVELPVKSSVITNEGLETRRSKRKRRSDVEKNDSIADKNVTKVPKLDITESKTSVDVMLNKSKILINNSDHQDDVLEQDKIDSEVEIKTDTTLNESIAREADEDIPKQSEEPVRCRIFQLKRPQPVVIVETLNLNTLESHIKVQNITHAHGAAHLKAKRTKNAVKLLESDNVADKHISVRNEINSEAPENVSSSKSNGKTVEYDSKPNTAILSENFDLSVTEVEKHKTGALNKQGLNNDKFTSANTDIGSEKNDVDNNKAINTTEVVQNDIANKCLNDSDINMSGSDIKTEIKEFVKPSETKISKLGTKNVVIGEETYIFDRTLSQDYDEIESDKLEEVNNEIVHSSFQEPNNKDNCAKKTYDFVFEETLSQDYDEFDNDAIEDKLLEIDENSESIWPKTDESANKIPSEINVNDVECDKTHETAENKDGARKEKYDFVFEETLSQCYDEIDSDAIENINSKIGVNSESNLPKYNEFASNDVNNDKSDSTSLDKVKVETEIEDDNAISLLTSNKDSYSLNSDDKLSNRINETDSIRPHSTEEISNNESVKEAKVEKQQKSPRLSLKRARNIPNKHIDVAVQGKTSQVSDDTFLDTQNKEVPNENNISIAKNEPDTETKGSEIEVSRDGTNSKDPTVNSFIEIKERSSVTKIKEEFDPETASINSEDSAASTTRRKNRTKEKHDVKKGTDDPEFLKYLELRQDALIDEQPELTQDEIVTYLYQTWLYEESNKSETKKTDDVEQSKLVKGLNQDIRPQPKKKKKIKVEKETNVDTKDIVPKEKPKRKATQAKPYYNEDYSDLEEEDLETFNIFDSDVEVLDEDGQEIDEVELYFEKLKKPKPNVFKGFVRERVCEICELTGNLVKCKSCHAMFHPDCDKKEEEIVEIQAPTRGRKKKKARGRKPKGYAESLLDSGSQSDEKSQDANSTEEFNMSLEDDFESHLSFDAENFEAQWELKMKELKLDTVEEFESDQEVHWDLPPGECEIVDVKLKEKPIDYSNWKCKNCEKYDTPVCFVCKSTKSPKDLVVDRQKCHVAHCHRYYHLECLTHWPQTQFNSWEPSKTNKKAIVYVEALSCPRHVCHTCVSDDPRGCKTRFSGDKLARCVRCPATYHAFTKCLPAGTQILTGSQIICPRHYEHRPGKVPCHVNTGWCFICALGGTLICCEYCPTSFHAECLNIKPPEGSYMCEDCETGRLPLYGEMVWVKLGHYRWWPGIVLHPTEIPENIMAVKHSPGEFVVRFFGQYDHYWVNRGRVFPFQEGDSGRISSQKSKIDAAFTTAMEHAQRACEILKNVEPNEEEEEDIASSLLPARYVKLKVNKPVGSLTARRDIDANSLTQCDCDPAQPDPCGPYSHCLNRMLLTECGPLCRAGERCNNRAFERRDYPRLAPYRTPQRGWGLRTLEDIRQGQFVIEYVGELIDEEEYRRRMCRMHEIRDENFYFLTLDKERMIDAGPKGNLARFMNHCCEPNCETQKWTVLGDVRVGLFAMRDIPANSEVTFNYNLECAGIEKKRCLCGAKRCSGYIGAKPKQEEAQPKKLKVPVKRTYKKRKNIEDSPSTSKIKPPIKIKIIKPMKPRELTEIEKDLLIIKNATNGMSSDSEGSRLSSVDEKKDPKALKRKRVSFSTEESSSNTSVKKIKLNDSDAVGD